MLYEIWQMSTSHCHVGRPSYCIHHEWTDHLLLLAHLDMSPQNWEWGQQQQLHFYMTWTYIIQLQYKLQVSAHTTIWQWKRNWKDAGREKETGLFSGAKAHLDPQTQSDQRSVTVELQYWVIWYTVRTKQILSLSIYGIYGYIRLMASHEISISLSKTHFFECHWFLMVFAVKLVNQRFFRQQIIENSWGAYKSSDLAVLSRASAERQEVDMCCSDAASDADVWFSRLIDVETFLRKVCGVHEDWRGAGNDGLDLEKKWVCTNKNDRDVGEGEFTLPENNQKDAEDVPVTSHDSKRTESSPTRSSLWGPQCTPVFKGTPFLSNSADWISTNDLFC